MENSGLSFGVRKQSCRFPLGGLVLSPAPMGNLPHPSDPMPRTLNHTPPGRGKGYGRLERALGALVFACTVLAQRLAGTLALPFASGSAGSLEFRLIWEWLGAYLWLMTKENVRGAIENNRPFVISMADGKEYAVPHRDFIAFTRKGTSVVVSTEDDQVHILPLITMTGISQGSSSEGGVVNGL